MDHTHLERAIGGLAKRWYAVTPSQWDLPTPCDEWNVRALLNHIVVELLWIPPLLSGQTIAEVGDRFAGDVVGFGPKEAASVAAHDAVRAAGQAGALERTVELSFGSFPGADYVGQVTSDVLIHTWDLARAVGADERLEADLLEAAEPFLQQQLDGYGSAGAFGAAVSVAASGDIQARLLAQTGRDAG